VRQEARSIVEGTDTAMRRPEETSRWFARTADGILAQVALAEKANGGHGDGKEFRTTITDLKILAGLARYHARRLLAGSATTSTRRPRPGVFRRSHRYEKRRARCLGTDGGGRRRRLQREPGLRRARRRFSRHWKEERQKLARDFEQLQAERRKAVAKAGATHFALHADSGAPPPPACCDGSRLEVAARVTAPAGVKWVRLRYRHARNSRITDRRHDP